MIKIQKKDFNTELELKKIKKIHLNVGAISTFIGYVRNENNKKKVNGIYLEVYKDMAKIKLEDICKKASKKWSLSDTLVIHRYGKLAVNEKIVLVATFSKHRKQSFESCHYIMNYLKKDAPFWKKEFYYNKSKWL
tara:strand:- start:137 stop:541 length:405 start_codon:yes stop_codon:yes gene_type:complete